MQSLRSWAPRELKALIALAVPIGIGNLAEMAMTLTDMVMLGRLGAVALAAGGLGINIFWCAMIVPLGMTMAVGPVVAHAHGAGEKRACGRAAGQGLWIAAAVGLPAMLVLWWAGPAVGRFALEPQVAALLSEYLQAVLWSLPAILGFSVLQRFVGALFRPRVPTAINLVAVALKILANSALIYGSFGFPALGVAGAGWSTTAVCWLQFAALAVYVGCHPAYRAHRPYGGLWPVDRRVLGVMFALGWPISGSMAVESWFFMATGLVISVFGTAVLAAHQIAVVSSSLSYMVTLAIASAATYRVAHAVGAGRPSAARGSGLLAIAAAAAFMGAVAVLIWLNAHRIVGLFLDLDTPANAAVLPIAVTLLSIVAVFQVADGVQCVAAGALRGLQDTRSALLAALIGYWVAGAGSGFGLGFGLGFGPAGLWAGLAVGLAAAATVLTLRFRSKAEALVGEGGRI